MSAQPGNRSASGLAVVGSWCLVDRALLVMALTSPFAIIYAARSHYLILHPEIEPYWNRGALAWFRDFLGGAVLGWAVLALVAVWLRRRNGDSAWFAHLTNLSWWIVLVFSSYAMGTVTSPVAIGLVAGGLSMLLLFEKRIAIPDMTFGLVILVALTIAERARLLPYAPLLDSLPMEGDRPSDEYVWGASLAALGLLVGLSALFSAIVTRWRDRELRLREALRALESARTSEQSLLQSYRDYKAVFEAAHDPILLLDPHGTVLSPNRKACELYGYGREELTGNRLDLFSGDADRERQTIAEVARSHAPASYETVHFRRDGSAVYLDVEASLVRHQGDDAVLALCRNVTERRRAQRALQTSQRRYALAVEAANDGIWEWDFVSAEVFYSSRWLDMLQLDDEELTRTPDDWLGRIHPDDVSTVRESLDAHLGGLRDHFESEHRIQRADGTYRWFLCRGQATRLPDGTPERMAGSLSDIHARKKAEEKLIYDALHDSLTGLPNRALFMNRLSHALERERRDPSAQLAVFFMDLDRFKVINDSLGHDVGDRLLIQVAERLRHNLRSIDTPARLGGDEFAVLTEGSTRESDTIQTARRILEAVERPFRLDGQTIHLGASIGIARGGRGDATPTDLLRDADIAMYRAKGSGQGVAVFDDEMHRAALSRMKMEHGLHEAIEEGKLLLHFQPIVSLPSREVVELEALARWRHSDGRLATPTDFIALAEESRLIDRIGRHAIRLACTQLRTWTRELTQGRNLRVGVNVSGVQLSKARFAQDVEEAIFDSGLEPGNLTLEITESMILSHSEHALDNLLRLHSMGVRVALDDFGTGFSSLERLHQLPIDCLKIDRSFVQKLEDDPRSRQIARSVITLAHELDKEVVAEGVETQQQLDLLMEWGCNLGQGWLFSKPLEPGDVAALFARRPPSSEPSLEPPASEIATP